MDHIIQIVEVNVGDIPPFEDISLGAKTEGCCLIVGDLLETLQSGLDSRRYSLGNDTLRGRSVSVGFVNDKVAASGIKSHRLVVVTEDRVLDQGYELFGVSRFRFGFSKLVFRVAIKRREFDVVVVFLVVQVSVVVCLGFSTAQAHPPLISIKGGCRLSNIISGIKSSGSWLLWLSRIDQEEVFIVHLSGVAGYRQIKVLEFFDFPGLRQGVEDLRELLHKQRDKRMASMNTRLNIEKLDGNIIQKYDGSKQVWFKQLGPDVKIGVHEVHDEKRVWFEVELQGAQGNRKAEVFQVSNDDTAVAQRRLEDKQPEEKTTTNCLVKEQKNKYQTGWKIKTGNVLDSYNQRFTQQCIKSVVAKYLGVARIQQQNRLVDETNMTLFAKVVLYRNMGFNDSEEYKKTFIGPNVGAGLQEVQTQDLMDNQLARDREQHLACELLGYREDSNEAAFAVTVVKKIYAHESLTFNDTVACEVISKWKVGLKDNMDAQSDVYVLSNSCKKCSDGYYWSIHQGLLDKAKGNVLGMNIVRDQSGNTLRVSQSRFYNRKLVQTFLEGHSILSLDGSLSGDCDVEKNGKSSCIYTVGSQEYQMVCTRLDIASADVGSLKANLQHMEALSTTEAGYMTFIEAWKKEIWLNTGGSCCVSVLTNSDTKVEIVRYSIHFSQ
nr:zinc finger, CCHC-type [Tanacetum cinerariifolium]